MNWLVVMYHVECCPASAFVKQWNVLEKIGGSRTRAEVG